MKRTKEKPSPRDWKGLSEEGLAVLTATTTPEDDHAKSVIDYEAAMATYSVDLRRLRMSERAMLKARELRDIAAARLGK